MLAEWPCIRVQFPASWPGWHIPELVLTAATLDLTTTTTHTHGIVGGDHATLTVRVDADSTADYSGDSPVLPASLSLSLSSSPSPSPPSSSSSSSYAHHPRVVLKFALREDLVPALAAEAAVYAAALLPLQGAAVPRCFGLYAGRAPETGAAIACLVLERWGECLREPFHALSLPLRLRVLERLAAIHRRGVWHGDFAERNVLERDGDIRIIDFDDARTHTCACAMDFSPGAAAPDPDAFGCRQLWEICRADMRLWG